MCSTLAVCCLTGEAIIRSGSVAPTSTQFSGLVFKLQANMDPRHRDKVAFVRVVSGEALHSHMQALHACKPTCKSTWTRATETR